MKRIWPTALLTCALTLIGGCANDPIMQKSIDASAASAARELQDMHGREQPAALVRESGYWVAPSKPISLREKLPEVLTRNVELSSGRPIGIAMIARRVTEATGVPVRIEPDVFSTFNTQTGSSTDATGRTTATRGIASDVATAGDAISYVHSGTLKTFLDMVTSRLNLTWQYEEGVIVFRRMTTKVFTLHVLPGEFQHNTAIGSQNTAESSNDSTGVSAGGTSKGQSSQSTRMGLKLSTWESVVSSVQSMLSPWGRMSSSEGSGAIVVTDAPDVIRRVGQYIEMENASLTRQVAFEVKVLSISRSNTDRLGVSWNPLQLIGSDISLGITSNALVTGGNNVINGTLLSGDFSGTSLVVDALAKVGNVSTLTSATLTTLNNRPVPLEISRTTAYLKEVTTSQVADTGTTLTSLTPGEVTTGFMLSLMPRVLEDDRLLVQYMVELSSLLGFDTQSSGEQSIRTPEYDRRAMMEQVVVRSGQVLALSGFEQINDNLEKQGTGSPNNWLLGGGRNATRDHTIIVVLITPVLMNREPSLADAR